MKLNKDEVVLYRDEPNRCWRVELQGCGVGSLNRDLPILSIKELENIRDVIIAAIGLPEGGDV